MWVLPRFFSFRCNGIDFHSSDSAIGFHGNSPFVLRLRSVGSITASFSSATVICSCRVSAPQAHFLICPRTERKWGNSFMINFFLRVIVALLYPLSSQAPHRAFLRELNSFACHRFFPFVVARYLLNASRFPKVATWSNLPVFLLNFKWIARPAGRGMVCLLTRFE